MLFSNKNIVILCLFLLLLNGVFAYDFGNMTINHDNPEEIRNFNINKVENYTYYLTFEHHGLMHGNLKVNIYINGNLIYTIDNSNMGYYMYNIKNASIDITNYLNDGSNTLKVEGINFYPSLRIFYYLNNTHINEPSTINSTIRVPISITQVILYTITTVFIGIQYLKSIKS